MKTACRPIVFVAAAVLLGVAFGCASPDETSFSSIAGDLTPDLIGTQQRPVDLDRSLAVYSNQQWRSASDDVNRLMYTDHPSRLSPFPVMSLTGQPR